MIQEWMIKYTDGTVGRSVTVGNDEYEDQLAYCQEGKRAGWIEEYDVIYEGIDK